MKPCPFCGADQNDMHGYPEYVLSPNGTKLARHCWKCGATARGGSRGKGAERAMIEADKEWNRRAEQ